MLALPAVQAQEAPPAQDPTQLEKTTVIGTFIPTAETIGVAPVNVVSSEKITELGSSDILVSLKKIEPTLTGNVNIGQEVNNGGSGESNIGLRNLRTLVLINGRRLGNSSFSNGQFVDLNTIPLAAIERIEVLKDGSSALYGSEAIGGVVNIVTKKNFSGVEIGGRYGVATGDGHTSEYGASIVGGTSNDKTSFMGAAQFYHMDPLKTTERPNVAGLDYNQLQAEGIYGGGVSYLSPSFPGKMSDSSGTYYLNPAYPTPPVLPGQTFGGPTAIANYLAAFAAANPGAPAPYTKTPPSTAPFYAAGLLNTTQFGTHSIQEQDRKNFLGQASHQIFEKRMEVFSDFLYANIESEGSLAPSPVTGLGAKQSNINIPANNPYNPFGVALGPAGGATGLPPGGPRIRSRFVDSGNRLFQSQTDYYHFVGGLKGELDGGWGYNAAYTYNRYDQIQYTRNAINGAALDLALQPNGQVDAQGRPLSNLPGLSAQNVPVYNIFAAGGQNAPETLERLRTTLYQSGVSEQWDATGVVNGEIFELPAGKIGIAFGGSFGSEQLNIDFDGLTKIGKVPGLNANNPTFGRRDNWAGFAEVRIPLTNPEMDIPVLRSFEITAAGRYEEFDPGGDSAVPKVGVRWQPLDEQFTLRGTYSESFIAPTTYELFGGSAVNVPLLAAPRTAAGGLGFFQEYTSNLSNRELTPSDAKQYGGGLVFSPKGVKGLTLSVDYYNIKTENDIYRVSQQEMVNSINSLGHTSPWASYFSKANGSGVLAGPGGAIIANQANDQDWGNLEVPLLNGAQIETDGIDLTATYALETEQVGTFTFFANANVTLNFEYQDPVSGGPYPYDGQYTDAALGIAGAQGTVPDYLITCGVTWDIPIGKDGLAFTVNAQYIPEVDSYGSIHPSNMAFENAVDDGLNDYTVDGSVWTVDSYYRIDMQLSYEIGKHKDKEAKSWYDDTRFTVGCNNITDNDPPLIAAAFEDNTDKQTYDIMGRFVYFEIAKKF